MKFFALGTPVPQGSKRGFATKSGKVVLVEQGGQRHKSWRESVSYAAYEAREGVLEGPLELHAEFLMPRPKSKPKAIWVDVQPDVDKLLRAVLDSLTHVIYSDDKLVVKVVGSKRYTREDEVPGCWIEVSPIPDL